MRAADFLRDKTLHLSGVGFAVLFTAVLLAVLRQPPAAAAFLCLVEALCALIPLALEFARKRRFYNEVLPPLEALEEKYLISALLGTVTPFCSCSSIPLFIGFTSAGLPLGVTFSFLISSPMVDLGSLLLLSSIFGWKIA